MFRILATVDLYLMVALLHLLPPASGSRLRIALSRVVLLYQWWRIGTDWLLRLRLDEQRLLRDGRVVLRVAHFKSRGHMEDLWLLRCLLLLLKECLQLPLLHGLLGLGSVLRELVLVWDFNWLGDLSGWSFIVLGILDRLTCIVRVSINSSSIVFVLVPLLPSSGFVTHLLHLDAPLRPVAVRVAVDQG